MSLSTASMAVRMLLAIAIAMPLAQSAVQQTLTKKELKELTASAKTAADHERLAEHYRSEASRNSPNTMRTDSISKQIPHHGRPLPQSGCVTEWRL
jgi:hypothetical protein